MTFNFSLILNKDISSSNKETGYTITPYQGGLACISANLLESQLIYFDFIYTERPDYHLWQVIGVDQEQNIYVFKEEGIFRQVGHSGTSQLIASSLKCSEIADISVSPGGLVLCVGYNPNEFDLISGSAAHFSKTTYEQKSLPFWETGANCICAAKDYFAVGRSEVGGIDFYTYSGEFLNTIDEFNFNGKLYSLRDEYITKIFIDQDKNTWVTNDADVYIFNSTGNIEYVSTPNEYTFQGEHIEFGRLFGVDKSKGLWGTWKNRPIRFLR